MLYLISLGLNKGDITLSALEAIRKSKALYLDIYTNYCPSTIKELEKLFKKKIIEANRELLENNSKEIINKAKKENISILVSGNALAATTHISLLIEAKENNIKTEVIHASSILTAIAETGLSLYNFGKIASIPFNNKGIETPYEILKQNLNCNAHTLFLLDLNPEKKEFLKLNQALTYLLKSKLISKNNIAIACIALKTKYQKIMAKKVNELLKIKYPDLPQSLIIPAKKLHFIEQEFLNYIK